jgi:dTDP-4-amino-4,6-dideoxygalactose transaminase
MKGQKLIRFHKANIPNIDVSDILKSGQVTNGKYVRELERLLCKMHKAKYAICFSSATASTLVLFHILREDYKRFSVAMPSFTWKSPRIAMNMLDIKIDWMDVEDDTWTVSYEDQKTTERIFKPNYFFLTSTLGRIPDLAEPEKTIIDGATNAGYFDMKSHECLALIVGFSPAKAITGIEGGAIITNKKWIYERSKSYQPAMFRMGEINAKIAIHNLKLVKEIRRQKEIFYHIYKTHLPFAKFQKIDKNHSLCEIAAVFPFNEKQWKEVAKGMEIKKRYDPLVYGENAMKIYKNVMSLPSYSGCDYKGVIRLLRKVYYG